MILNPTLIINADDFGADIGRNQGIIQAMRAGRVTDASLLANAPGFENAVLDLHAYHSVRNCFTRVTEKLSFASTTTCPDTRDPKTDASRDIGMHTARQAPTRRKGAKTSDAPGIGLHLNLSQGRPLSTDVSILTTPQGDFPGKQTTLARLIAPAGPELSAAIAREARAQIERLLESGLRLTHLDGHHHIHLFPAVLPTVVALAREYRIPWLRLPCDTAPPAPSSIDPQRAREAALFCALAKEARPIISKHGLNFTDHFCGLHLIDRLTPISLRETLSRLGEGVTELMVHPGLISPLSTSANPGECAHEPVSEFTLFATSYRQQELDALFLPDWRELIDQFQIRLASFDTLECE